MLAAFLPALNQCCSVSLQQLFLKELGLADAIQALSEVYQAITESECDLLISSPLMNQGDSNLPKQRKLFRELVG